MYLCLEHKQAIIIPLLHCCSIIRYQASSDLTLPKHCASLQRTSVFWYHLHSLLFQSPSSHFLAFWTVSPEASAVLSCCLLQVVFYVCSHLCISQHLI